MCSPQLADCLPTRGHWAQAAFPHREEAVGAARDFATRNLTNWGLPEELRRDVQVCVSEAATNVLKHTEKSDFTLCLHYSEDHQLLHVHVADTDPASPPIARKNPLPDATSGRGLLLIECLAREWNVTYGDIDKTITFTFETPYTRPEIQAPQ